MACVNHSESFEAQKGRAEGIGKARAIRGAGMWKIVDGDAFKAYLACP